MVGPSIEIGLLGNTRGAILLGDIEEIIRKRAHVKVDYCKLIGDGARERGLKTDLKIEHRSTHVTTDEPDVVCALPICNSGSHASRFN